MKKNTFVINGKEYKTKPLTYNAICELEDLGIDITMLGKAKLSLIRGYVALCGNISAVSAGAEIEQHLINGGTFDEVLTIISDEVANSDFFQNLNKGANKETTED